MNQILAVLCASITGISLGVTLHHKRSLEAPSPVVQYPSATMDQTAYEVNTSGTGNVLPNHSTSLAASSIGSSTQLENKLNTLLEQQEAMRSQQSELNRELNTIQFRLDTHSASFRPLQSERDTEVLRTNTSPLTPLLPPRQ